MTTIKVIARRPLVAASIGALVLVVLAAAAAPWICSHDPAAQDLALGPTPPGAGHVFGTDYEGRDLMARVIHGARVSIFVGALATFFAVILGVTWGAVAGYVGGRVDQVMMRLVDVFYGLPFMFFVIILMVWFGRGTWNLVVGLTAISWLTMARIVRSVVVSLRHRDFVEAAVAQGASTFTILRRHVIPNAMGPIVVYATLTVPKVMMEEAFLSFLGLGVQPPASSWGALLSDGASLYREYPWLLAYPAAALAVTLLALNILGDALRDELDPRTGAGR